MCARAPKILGTEKCSARVGSHPCPAKVLSRHAAMLQEHPKRSLITQRVARPPVFARTEGIPLGSTVLQKDNGHRGLTFSTRECSVTRGTCDGCVLPRTNHRLAWSDKQRSGVDSVA